MAPAKRPPVATCQLWGLITCAEAGSGTFLPGRAHRCWHQAGGLSATRLPWRPAGSPQGLAGGGEGGGHSDWTTQQRRLGREECALGPLWETTGSSVASPGHQPGPEAVAASLPEGSMLAQTLERGGGGSYQPHPSCLKGWIWKASWKRFDSPDW